jgi:uncharacterized membrane protein
LEALAGGNWLAKLGVVAITIAVGLFLQYAFRNGWVSPTMQVAAGLTLSAVMMGAGQFLLKKETYHKYAQVVMSGGIMVYFLSIYAAYNFYTPALIGYTWAFVALAAGAVAASVLATKNNTEVVALLCILGAFSAPVLIRSAGTGTAPPYGLYGYLTFLNVWVYLLVRLRGWASLSVVGLGATWLLFLGAGSYQAQGWRVEGISALFLFFSCYQGIHLLNGYAKSAEYSEEADVAPSVFAGLALILIGSLVFAATSISILGNELLFGVPDITLVGIGLTLLLVWLSLSLPKMGRYDRQIRQTAGVLASGAFLWLMGTSLGASESLPREQAPSTFIFSVVTYILFLSVAVTLFKKSGDSATTSLLVIANAIIHVWMSAVALGKMESWRGATFALWMPVAGWITLLALSGVVKLAQKTEYFTRTLALLTHALILNGCFSTNSIGESPRIALLFAGEFLLISGTWIAVRKQTAWEWFRADRVALFANVVLFCGYIDYVTSPTPFHGVVPMPAWGLAFAAYHALVGTLLFAKSVEQKLDRLLYYGVSTSLLAICFALQFRGGAITFAWAAEATALVLTGFAVKDVRVRTYGLSLLGLAVGKAMLVDVIETPIPFLLFWNARFLSGASVIAAASLCAYSYWKRKSEVLEQEVNALWALCFIAHGVTLVFVSCDLWKHAQLHWSAAGQTYSPQLTLSIFWTTYALLGVCFGIVKRSRPARIFSMALLYFFVLKVFVYDLSGLEGVYRIVSFFVLGLILLTVSLLYTRFEAQMREEPKPEANAA